jgi:MFS family permease
MGKFVTIGSGIFLAIGGKLQKCDTPVCFVDRLLTCVCIQGFLFGYDSGVITSTIGQPTFITYFGTPNPSQKGGIVSSFTGGAIIGALAVSWLADMLGRKKTVFIGGCISALGCALQAGSATIAMLIAGRFIAGIAVGLLSAIVPMYCVRSPESSSRQIPPY